MNHKEAICELELEDDSSFLGNHFGFSKNTSGEVVFNTGMVGYPETLTDPSYRGQILVLTYPLIGNYGVPSKENRRENNLLKNFESDEIQVRGLICSDYSFRYNHWNADQSLDEWLRKEQIPAIYGVDTRKLTKKLREKGTMLGRLNIKDRTSLKEEEFFDPDEHRIVESVSCSKPLTYQPDTKKGYTTVLGLDCGIKHSMVRAFLKENIKFIRVPFDFDPFVEGIDFDALFVSNGPGDPTWNKKTIETIKKTIDKEMPIMGICLGNQLLALAAGADTYKLKYGHRAQNQPVSDLETDRCYITSQNHGYSVEKDSLPENWKVWFKNINDGTVEGIKHKDKPFFGLQFHPEASPGPTDSRFMFDRFIEEVRRYGKTD